MTTDMWCNFDKQLFDYNLFCPAPVDFMGSYAAPRTCAHKFYRRMFVTVYKSVRVLIPTMSSNKGGLLH